MVVERPGRAAQIIPRAAPAVQSKMYWGVNAAKNEYSMGSTLLQYEGFHSASLLHKPVKYGVTRQQYLKEETEEGAEYQRDQYRDKGNLDPTPFSPKNRKGPEKKKKTRDFKRHPPGKHEQVGGNQ